jgi:hypothetical protein
MGGVKPPFLFKLIKEYYMVDFPKDESGVSFDPEVHNLVEETATPQLSQKGNFVKLRPNHKNADATIERFIDGLANSLDNDLGLSGLIVEDGEDEALVEEPVESSDDEGFRIEDVELPKEEPAKVHAVVTSKVNGNTTMHRQMIVGTVASENNKDPRGRADFSAGYNFAGVDLSDADLRSAILKNCVFDGANFSGANCEGVDFRGCSLKGANFSGANLNFALLPVSLSEFKKQTVTNLDTVMSEVY